MNTVKLQPVSSNELLKLVLEAESLFLIANEDLTLPNQRRFAGLRAGFYQTLKEDLLEEGARAALEGNQTTALQGDSAILSACLEIESDILAAMKAEHSYGSPGEINSIEWHFDYLKSLAETVSLAA